LIVQVSVADADYLWAEKRKELLGVHLHCLETGIDKFVQCVDLVLHNRDANDLRLKSSKDIHYQILHIL
jgi:hypothetical protein